MVTPNWVHRPGDAPRLVHVSAPAHSGAPTGLVRGLVAAQAGAGRSVGWAVIDGDATFFAFTRYLHQLLHGRADSHTSEQLATGSPHYRAVLTAQAEALAEELAPGDVVVLHDPQTLGMAPTLADAGHKVVWHCHVGTTDEEASGPAAVWDMVRAELSTVDAVVSGLPEFAPRAVPAAHRHIVKPAVDPDSARNRPLSRNEVSALLADLGLTGTVHDDSRVTQDGPLPDDAPVVLQLARWEPVADMRGVLTCVPELPPEVHVVLAGHDPDEGVDDPDGRAVLKEIRAVLADFSAADRARVHLVRLSTRDDERTARTVNALQRRADIVLQKSFAEGSGLTVTEAMLKGGAVVAADVGGLRQQISPGHNGVLVNPRDLGQTVEALRTLIDDPLLRRRLGKHAEESARSRYLMHRLVEDYAPFGPVGPAPRVRDVA